MALPHDQWHEIVSGPGAWDIIKALFRDVREENDEGYKRLFTVVELGCPRKYRFQVMVRDVHRLPGGKFMIRGSVLELNGQEWESLGGRFVAHYNPETREGSFKIITDRDI